MKILPRLILCVLAFAPAATLLAQDLTVGEILNCEPDRALDRLPSVAGTWSPTPPAELAAAAGPELVFLQLLVQPTGNFDHCTRGTNPVLNKSAGQALKGLTLAPAQVQDRATDAYVWLPLIFNPAAAAVGPRDAIPRVLAAAPFLAPAELFAELKLGDTSKAPLAATLEIGADGTLLKFVLDHADARLQPLVERTLRQWRFAPARRDGQPTAASFRVPVSFFSERVLQRPGAADMVPDVRPKAVRTAPPKYPPELLKARIAGRVIVHFTVDTQGRVQNPQVVKSSHPGFARPALAAVRGWLFSPALRAGKPVPLSLEVPVTFAPPR